jgi:DNA repair protein RecO (recombination protein O)
VNDLRDDAVVLRTYRTGEADRVVVMWTRDHGKIRTIAKGVRKPSTRIGGSLEPTAEVTVFLASGRSSLSIVRQVELRARRDVMRSTYERLTAAMAVIEAVDAIPLDDVADPEVFDLLTRTLEALDRPEYDPTLVPAAFFLRLLAHDGSEPVVNECVNCASPGPLVSFDAAAGGALCANCRSGRPVSPEAIALLQRILGGGLGEVLRETNPPGAAEVAALCHDAIEAHLGRRLKVLRSSPSA